MEEGATSPVIVTVLLAAVLSKRDVYKRQDEDRSLRSYRYAQPRSDLQRRRSNLRSSDRLRIAGIEMCIRDSL